MESKFYSRVMQKKKGGNKNNRVCFPNKKKKVTSFCGVQTDFCTEPIWKGRSNNLESRHSLRAKWCVWFPPGYAKIDYVVI